ncbi:hypothetical protein D9V86_01530 [Bacteroidetes/Chlorobi group bacterium ChocPot_Mid]|nr:MAG: hypothetical protein D9V86_01530 [Bacteroidetes/Chlorobi group bacterium ChocPot_Mid]
MAQATEVKKYKAQPQHVILFVILVVLLYIFVFFKVIPFGVSSFVVSLFQPSGERLEKIGFVKFDGLVWASTLKENEKKYQGGIEIKKEYINREFIFDFSFHERKTEIDGYVKGKWEFYAKSETLGEFPIILEPWVGFWILALVVSFLISAFITMMLPSSIGLMAILFEKQIDNTKVKIRLQTGFSDDIVELLIAPNDKLAEEDRDKIVSVYRYIWERTVTDDPSSTQHSHRFEEEFNDNTDIVLFRNEQIYERIKEYYSDFVVKEIEDTKDGLMWRKNHILFGKGLRLYMAHHFTEKYSNNVTGMAYGGAGFLIIAVGIRGLKFIPATKPSFILLAIFLEFSMLMLMAVTLFYTEEEERMDKMLKKMEDANRSQLETLRGQQHDIHQLTNALVGQTAEIIKSRVEKAISEYMASSENVDKAIANEISSKIMKGLREAYSDKK